MKDTVSGLQISPECCGKMGALLCTAEPGLPPWEGMQGRGRREHDSFAPSSPNASVLQMLPQEQGTWRKCCRNGRLVLAIERN